LLGSVGKVADGWVYNHKKQFICCAYELDEAEAVTDSYETVATYLHSPNIYYMALCGR